MSIKGVIFDFNGTLFWDTPFHNKAWDIFLENHQIEMTDQEKDEKIHGKPNSAIFKGIFNREIPEDELSTYINEKEQIYREICLHEQKPLAKGAIGLLNDLQANAIPFTIATSSEIGNVRFFFEQFELERWFDMDQVIYDDGTLRGKPHPDFFLKAMERLKLKPEESLIFEDSIAGIKAAENAGAGKIIIVNSSQSNFGHSRHHVISDFDEVDRKLFKSS